MNFNWIELPEDRGFININGIRAVTTDGTCEALFYWNDPSIPPLAVEFDAQASLLDTLSRFAEAIAYETKQRNPNEEKQQS